MSARDTHVLIDEKGMPLVRGTLKEILDSAKACAELGITDIAVKQIRASQIQDD